MEVFLANIEHLEEISKLFDQYRIFYGASSDLDAARKFLRERFQKKESIIFAVSHSDLIIGFAQLYPRFSSVSMKPILILNDLFVDEFHRRNGTAKLLITAVKKIAQEAGVIRITLATKNTNISAQKLYESCGYTKDPEVLNALLKVEKHALLWFV